MIDDTDKQTSPSCWPCQRRLPLPAAHSLPRLEERHVRGYCTSAYSAIRYQQKIVSVSCSTTGDRSIGERLSSAYATTRLRLRIAFREKFICQLCSAACRVLYALFAPSPGLQNAAHSPPILVFWAEYPVRVIHRRPRVRDGADGRGHWPTAVLCLVKPKQAGEKWIFPLCASVNWTAG